MSARVTISIVTYTAVAAARKCIASVLQHAPDAKLILTANGNAEAYDFFKTVPGAFIVSNAENKGFGRPHNFALSICETEFMLCLNDDCVVPAGFLDALLAPCDRDPKAALACPDNGCSALLPTFHGRTGPKEYCEGACLMVRCDVARKHGLFDETLPGLAYGEDSDASLRYRQLGYTLHWVKLPGLQHAVASTSKHMPQARQWQDANHAVLRLRWRHYLRARRFDVPTLIRRAAAYGDCLLVTPIIRALKEQRPLSPIFVETVCPEVFRGNPHVVKAAAKIPAMKDAVIIDLNGAYEDRKEVHIVDAYAERAGIENYTCRAEIYPSQADREWAERIMQPAGRFVAIHPGPLSWRSKEWPQHNWDALQAKVAAAGYVPFIVGDRATLRTTVGQLAAVIERCKFFIGVDSFPFHVAQAMDIPTIGLFGITDPRFICTTPDKGFHVCGTGPSFGERHRLVGKKLVDDGGSAMRTITVDQVFERVKEISKLLSDADVSKEEAFA